MYWENDDYAQGDRSGFLICNNEIVLVASWAAHRQPGDYDAFKKSRPEAAWYPLIKRLQEHRTYEDLTLVLKLGFFLETVA
jgi:hypothetical protein